MEWVIEPANRIVYVVWVLAVVYSGTIWSLVGRRRKVRREFRTGFRDTLVKAIVGGSVNDLGQATRLFEGCLADSPSGGLTAMDFPTELQVSFARVLSAKPIHGVLAEKERAVANEVAGKIDTLVVKSREVSPFGSLPPAERSALKDLMAYLEANDLKSARRKVDELAILISVKDESMERLERKVGWSVPFALAGILVSLVFGVMSVIPGG